MMLIRIISYLIRKHINYLSYNCNLLFFIFLFILINNNMNGNTISNSKLFLIYSILLLCLSNAFCAYTSINSLPNLKEGFSQFELGLPQGVKPLSYTDINNDK